MAKRQAKQEKSVKDLLTPVNIKGIKVSDDDCFGRMWDPSTGDCSICADVEVCGIVYQDRNIKPKVKKYEEEIKPLDLTDFDGVDWDKLVKVVKKYEQDGEPMTLDELIDAVSGLARTADKSAVENYIYREVDSQPLKIEGNIVFYDE